MFTYFWTYRNKTEEAVKKETEEYLLLITNQCYLIPVLLCGFSCFCPSFNAQCLN